MRCGVQLRSYVSASSFAIDDFEKDSGLITFSFGQSDISKYVDCGQWTEPESKFEGHYADYLGCSSKGTLSGKMNISVRQISENKISVKVNARYAFSAFSFESGNLDEVNGFRCRPTYVLEKGILDAVSSN